MAAMPNAGDALVYVNEDGSVRELTDAEKTYVEMERGPMSNRAISIVPPGASKAICRALKCRTACPSSYRRKTRCKRKHRERLQIR